MAKLDPETAVLALVVFIIATIFSGGVLLLGGLGWANAAVGGIMVGVVMAALALGAGKIIIEAFIHR